MPKNNKRKSVVKSFRTSPEAIKAAEEKGINLDEFLRICLENVGGAKFCETCGQQIKTNTKD